MCMCVTDSDSHLFTMLNVYMLNVVLINRINIDAISFALSISAISKLNRLWVQALKLYAEVRNLTYYSIVRF